MAQDSDVVGVDRRPCLRQVVDVAVDQLRVHPANPRRGRVDLIAQSLERYGQIRPAVAQRDGTVLVGNHMLKAARELGWRSLQVLYVDLAEEPAKKLLLWDNRLADVAENDAQALLELLESLEGLEGSGYEPQDLDELLEEVGPPAFEEDDVPPLPAAARTTPGELVVLGEHRLVCGDATDPRAWARLLEGERPENCMATTAGLVYCMRLIATLPERSDGGATAISAALSTANRNERLSHRIVPS